MFSALPLQLGHAILHTNHFFAQCTLLGNGPLGTISSGGSEKQMLISNRENPHLSPPILFPHFSTNETNLFPSFYTQPFPPVQNLPNLPEAV